MTQTSIFDRALRLQTILVVLGTVPLFVWRGYSRAVWPDVCMAAYLQGAVLFGILLVDSYPPIRTRWFVRSMIPVLLLHAIVQIVFAKVAISFAATDVRPPTGKCGDRRD